MTLLHRLVRLLTYGAHTFYLSAVVVLDAIHASHAFSASFAYVLLISGAVVLILELSKEV